MTSRLGSALSSCTNKYKSETVEVITSEDDLVDDSTANQYETDHKTDENIPDSKLVPTAADQAQPSFLWRFSSGAIGGAYNLASGAAGMGYNTTKWVLGKFSITSEEKKLSAFKELHRIPWCPHVYPSKGVEVGSTVVVTTKDVSGSVLNKTAAVGSNIVGKLPVPSKLKGKDKKE